MLENPLAASDTLKLTDQENSILHTLIYFNAFEHPLKPSEIHQFVPMKMSPMDVVPSLNFLENHHLVQKFRGYYGLEINESMIDNREKMNKSAERTMERAMRFSKWIRIVPFIRCVCISGWLSKGIVKTNESIKYFIITEPIASWLVRVFIVDLKKLLIFRNTKFHDVNDIIDLDHLYIAEKNMVTATEICTMIPLCGEDVFKKFLDVNEWVNEFRPNLKRMPGGLIQEKNTNLIKSLLERILRGEMGVKLDYKCMKTTKNNWQKQIQKLSKNQTKEIIQPSFYLSDDIPFNSRDQVLISISNEYAKFEKKHGKLLRPLPELPLPS